MAIITTTPASESNVSLRGPAGPPPSGGNGRSDSDYFDLRLRRARLGMLVAVIGVVMIFISFTSAYVVRQGLPTFDARTNSLVYDWLAVPLPALLLVNSFVLLLSSLTMELARRQASRDLTLARVTPITEASPKNESRISWLALTIVLGLGFLAGQLIVWRELAATGFYLSTTPSSSFLYLLTGMHGLHLLGGLVALLVAGTASLLRKQAATQLVLVDVTGWYWHFMAVLWIYILCLFEFVR
jgi:cytochrome c oxidase subunit III